MNIILWGLGIDGWGLPTVMCCIVAVDIPEPLGDSRGVVGCLGLRVFSIVFFTVGGSLSQVHQASCTRWRRRRRRRYLFRYDTLIERFAYQSIILYPLIRATNLHIRYHS